METQQFDVDNSNVPSRNWKMEPTSNDVSPLEILKKVTDPHNIASVIGASILTLVFSIGLLLYFKPNVVVNKNNGSVEPKKVFFIGVVLALIVGGTAWYLQSHSH